MAGGHDAVAMREPRPAGAEPPERSSEGSAGFYRMRYDATSLHRSHRPMNLVPEIAALDPEMRAWRHHLHAHPETAFEETATSAFVAEKLRAFGLEVHTGIARTGVVGVLRHGNVRPRADRPARRPRRAAHPRAVGRRAHVPARGQDARLRPRRPYDDAARRGAGHGAAQRTSTAPPTSSSSLPRRTRAAAA